MIIIFKERLKQLREEKGLTQQGLAEELKIGRASISNYELGTRTPDIEILSKLADFFGVTTDYLIGKSDYRTWEEEYIIKNFEKKYSFCEFDDFKCNNERKVILNKIILNNIEPLSKNIIIYFKNHLEIEQSKEPLEISLQMQKLIKDLLNFFEKLNEFTKHDNYFYAISPNLAINTFKNYINSNFNKTTQKTYNDIQFYEFIDMTNFLTNNLYPLSKEIYSDIQKIIGLYISNLSVSSKILNYIILKNSDNLPLNYKEKIAKNIEEIIQKISNDKENK
ncbi:helix-turn-helix domain-containing protein [Caloramator sp. E03]|uniref:helix-turn-helix domain-containing protein n=1 Tax=Caloramator sp. E03 TaxID=2576307 RepID=UPI00143CF128|nr:helix-turn-helix domain-containing protein [Caloramator sp. E03]